jgi:lycopene beta-cyclase
MKTELILVGSGLANSLIAYRILREHPDFPLLVVERGASIGANHTWSFHDSDLTADTSFASPADVAPSATATTR